MTNQVFWERTLLQASGSEVYVITDTSPLNALLYMPPHVRESRKVQELIEETLVLEASYDGITFYCLPVPTSVGHDPNRVHDEKQSAEINLIIPEVMEAYAPKLWKMVVRLNGDPEDRYKMARTCILLTSKR
jgi:hypothetical protein